MSLQSIKKELHKHIGKYAEYASDEGLKEIKLDDKEINLLLAKRIDWFCDDFILNALENCLPDVKHNHFAKPINDIVAIMDVLITINAEKKDKTLSVEKSYKYAIKLYENMHKDEMVLYNNLVELNYTGKKYNAILIFVCISCLIATILMLLFAIFKAYQFAK